MEITCDCLGDGPLAAKGVKGMANEAGVGTGAAHEEIAVKGYCCGPVWRHASGGSQVVVSSNLARAAEEEAASGGFGDRPLDFDANTALGVLGRRWWFDGFQGHIDARR